MLYINYYFKDLIKDGSNIVGKFESPDMGVYCDFIYNIITKDFQIFNSSLPIEEILPIPFYWLDKKIEENGVLKICESKISY